MRKPIRVSGQPCSGCGYCQLACSLIKTGSFNPLKARVVVSYASVGVSSVTFLEDCDSCGYCAKFCYYGVLKESAGE